MAKKSLLDKALNSVKKTSKKIVKKLTKDKGANPPQSKKYSVGKDATRKAKPQGYRFTDAGAKALKVRPQTKPTQAQIEHYKDKTTKSGHRYLYKEMRMDKSDQSRSQKFAKGGQVDKSRVSNALHAYKVAALWSSNDMDTDEPFDRNYDVNDFDKETSERMEKDVTKFYEENIEAIDASGLDDEQIGHDFWLSRNGHGAGFFDRGLDDDVEKKLMDAAKSFGECDLFAVDGKVIQEGGKKFKKGGMTDVDKNSKGGYTAKDGDYSINVHGKEPGDYEIICKIVTIDGKKTQVCYHETVDRSKKGVEVYTGSNYIVDSKDKSHSRLFSLEKLPAKYKSVVEELKEQHKKKFSGKKFAAGGSTGGDDPQIYVADLAAYNAGELVGEWLNLNDYSDADELMQAITDLTETWAEGHEEWAIHDTENIPRDLITEGSGSEDFEKFYTIKAKADEMSLPMEVLMQWVADTGADIDSADDAYQGEYDDEEDYAYRMVEDGVYTPSANDVYVSDTDKRIIAGEQEDYAIDGRDDDELIQMADMEDELKELEEKKDTIESIESEIEDLESELSDIEDEESDEYKTKEEELLAKQSELEEYKDFDFDDEKDNLVDRAKDKVKEEEYDKWYQGLSSDPIGFLVNDEGIYSEEDALKLPWIQVDYEAVAKELGYDINFVEHDGKTYAFSSNYRKGGQLKGDPDVKVYTPDMFAEGGSTTEDKYDDELQAEDVELFAENDSQLYNSRFLPIIKNLKKKLEKGTFDVNKAAILWKYYWEDADKRYQKQVLHRNPSGFVLSVNDRKLLSKKKAQEIKEQYDDDKLQEYKAGGSVNLTNDVLPGADEFKTGGLTAPTRINNAEAKEYTENRFPFMGANLQGKVLDNGDYVVLSYGYYPIWYYNAKEQKWYGTTDKYSNTTARQISQSRPTHDATMLSHNELLEKMRSEDARFDLGGIMTHDLIHPINNTDVAHN